MKTHPTSQGSRLALLLIALSLPAIGQAETCKSEDIQKDIACLKRLGISIDQFTEEYLHWVSDLQGKLQDLNEEEGRCAVLQMKAAEEPSLSVLQQIKIRCEGLWLEDRTRRFNKIKGDYIATKERYEKIRDLYAIAKELLALIEARQQRLEREYEQIHLQYR